MLKRCRRSRAHALSTGQMANSANPVRKESRRHAVAPASFLLTQGRSGERPGIVGFASFISRGFFEHLSKIGVFATRGFQVEDQIFDAQAKVIQAFLK